MRSSLRSLAFGLAGLLSAGAMAQQPYAWVITGTVSNCYAGQVVTLQTIQGTLPQQTITATVNSNCSYSAVLNVATSPSWVGVSTGCNGAVVSAWDSAQFNFVLDSAYSVIDLNCGGGGVYDCLQVLNGTDMPGTPCDDNDPITVNDVWLPNCVCQGISPQNCQADFTISQIGPWAIMATDQSYGVGPIAYSWWMPDGSTSTATNPIYTFTAPGTYGICLTITASNACTSVSCDTLYVDSAGAISYFPSYYDCLGAPNGPSVPGTPCQILGTILQGYWSPNCTCDSSSVIVYDCLGAPNGPAVQGTPCQIPGTILQGVWDLNCVCDTSNVLLFDCTGTLNGPNMPGTACNDGDTLTVQDTWSVNCACVGVPVNYYDCSGALNGPDLPGTPCNDNDPLTVNDTWDANCACTGGILQPCNADFWVLQAYTIDSLNSVPVPTPYELWIWNLSSGGSGVFSFFWNFGDGTSSTDAFPTHVYAGNGPYYLCLTILDSTGCQSTSCDSVSIDGNGLYTGMLSGGSDRQNGFTINVRIPQISGITDAVLAEGIATWPNPATDELNIALTNALSGTADVTVLDLNGRIVIADRRMLANGRNQLLLRTATLSPGMHVVRISNGTSSISQRFVRTN